MDKLTVAAVALRIAEKANECCYRSDGYQEELAAFAEREINALLQPNKESGDGN